MSASDTTASSLTLADAIADLRRELNKAMSASAGEVLKLRVTEIEAEFQVEVSRTVEGKAGVTVWNVVTLGGGASAQKGTTHTLRIKLDAWRSDGADGSGRGVDLDSTG